MQPVRALAALALAMALASAVAAEAGASSGPMAVYWLGDSIPAPFRVLGAVHAERHSNSTRVSILTEDEVALDLVRPARRLGADAIVRAHSSDFNGLESNEGCLRVSGLAVKLLPTAGPAAARGDSIIVALLPSVIPAQCVPDAGRAFETDRLIRDVLRRELENMGYYVSCPDVLPTDFRFENLAAMSDSALSTVCGELDGLIVQVALAQTSGWNIVEFAIRSATLTASVFSRSTRKLTSSSGVNGVGWSIGPLDTIFESLTGRRTRYSILKATQHLAHAVFPRVRR